MNLLRKIFTLSNILLAFAIGLIPFSINNFREANIQLDQLEKHAGIVEHKLLVTEVIDSQWKDFSHIVKLKLVNDPTEYSISFYPLGVNAQVDIGDSVEFFTKEIPLNQNEIIARESKSSNTNNEIFHIISRKYSTPVVDIKDYRASLRTNAWAGPVLSLIFFLWYLIRRYGSGDWFTFSVGNSEVRIG
jgi:hypothetical protein